MDCFDKPFRLDRSNIRYIDGKDINITPFSFSELKKPYTPKRIFYKIDGVEDYIIKDTTKNPLLFNGTRTKNILKKCSEKQPNFTNIDFPVGYYKENNKVKGTIIPYYKDSLSLYWFTCLSKFSELSNYYHHSDNEVDNLVLMYLDILKMIQDMYENDIAYLDIHAGNFLIYNNSVKVIDFEPDYVYFGEKKTNKYRERILKNYADLVHVSLKKLGFDDIIFNSSYFFDETEDHVKCLRKELRR